MPVTKPVTLPVMLQCSGDSMGRSTAKHLCTQPGDEARMGERVVGLARREGPRTFALAAREEGESGG